MPLGRFVSHLSGEEQKYLGDAGKFTISKAAIGGISFLSIPVFTRILTPDEYGILSVFVSAVSVFAVIYGLQLYGAVGRYWLEAREDFPDFLGTIVAALMAIAILEGLLFYTFRRGIMGFFSIPVELFPYLIAISFVSFGFSIYSNLLVVQRKANEYTGLCVTRAVGQLALSVVLMVLLTQDQYLGAIHGQLWVSVIIFLYTGWRLSRIARIGPRMQHLIYALSYTVPAIPGALAGFVLTFFDRIIINQLTGAATAGLYSLAYNVSMVIPVVFGGIFSAWFPRMVEYLDAGESDRFHRITEQKVTVVATIAVAIILFAPELIRLVSPSDYWSALGLIPVIVMGQLFSYLGQTYGFFTSYHKRRILAVSVNVVLCGIVNVALNYWAIPIWGYEAAAFTTAISYLLLFILNYLVVRVGLQDDSLPAALLLKTIAPVFLIWLAVWVSPLVLGERMVELLFRLAIMGIWVYWIMNRSSRKQ